MITKTFFLFFFLFTFSFGHTQVEKNFHYTCFQIYKSKHLLGKALAHHTALGSYVPKNYGYYSLAFYAALDLKDYKLAYKYLLKCVLTGMTPAESRNFEINSFDSITQQAIKTQLLDNYYSKHFSKFYCSKNDKGNLLKYTFAKGLFLKDQEARRLIDILGTSKDILNNINNVDSLNLDTLNKFIKTYGMITDNDVSRDANLSVLLLHLRRYKNKYLDSCIATNCRVGNLHFDCFTYADEQEALEDNKTIYGAINLSKITNIRFVDPMLIDEKRLMLGMNTLFEQSLYQNFILPSGYKVPEDLKKKYEKIIKELRLSNDLNSN